MENITQNDDEKLAQLTESLSPFLKTNPASKLILNHERIRLVNPWGDETIGIEIDAENKGVIDALNNIWLPPSLSALYHTDSLTLEFIYTVSEPENPLWNRKFEFIYNSCTYQCRYEESTDRLLEIAKALQFTKPPSSTEYRNFRIFRDYFRQSKLPPPLVEYFQDKKPISFFFGPIKVENNFDQFLELARHLNFYMAFFDRETPKIVVHQLEDTIEYDEQDLSDTFPEIILGTQIKTYMLDLWTGAQRATGRLAYLYYYQMLEYATFYFIEDKARLRIEKILRRPDILSSTNSYLEQAIDEIVVLREADDNKFDSVIARTVNPEKIWKIIAHYKDFFSEPQEFDGGFRMEPLVPKILSIDGFSGMWTPKVQQQLRKVRNALVHSREKREDKSIAPTRTNASKLHPWVKLIEEIACQVAIYQDT